ncbi:DUF4145 domain-containing protein [Pyxidicoccus fallax]|nr:DUF4145 domain-containing protein [Pyxidicoccus fallax]
MLHETMDGPSSGDDYPEYIYYQIIRCLGCETIAFRQHSEDYVTPGYVDDEGNIHPSTTTNVYPRLLKNRLKPHLYWPHPIPEIVRDIYNETINATKENALTLAGIGFRAIIEAICNDQKIHGKDLQRKINALAQKGMISKLEEKRLHAIRFLGNDAAHDIKRPSLASIQVVLKIVEHLIENIYILDAETQSNLETVIDTYDDFKGVLVASIKTLPPGDEKPLTSILGKTIRRLVNSLPAMEKQLTADIKAGAFPDLGMGKTVSIKNGSHVVQYYIKT